MFTVPLPRFILLSVSESITPPFIRSWGAVSLLCLLRHSTWAVCSRDRLTWDLTHGKSKNCSPKWMEESNVGVPGKVPWLLTLCPGYHGEGERCHLSTGFENSHVRGPLSSERDEHRHFHSSFRHQLVTVHLCMSPSPCWGGGTCPPGQTLGHSCSHSKEPIQTLNLTSAVKTLLALL